MHVEDRDGVERQRRINDSNNGGEADH